MNYEEFISQIRKNTGYPVQDAVWARIETTITAPQQRSYINNIFFFRPMWSIGVAAAVLITMLAFNSYKLAEYQSYSQLLGSTEYIFELCEYP